MENIPMEKSRILIIDDDKGICQSLAIILNQLGYLTTITEDGPSGIEAARIEEYKLILLDVVMPNMDGLETLKTIKEIAPASRVVMMTGFAVADHIAQAIYAGVDGVLYKPFDVDVVVNNLLSDDIVLIFEGYLQSAWDRIFPVVGSLSTKFIFKKAYARAFGEGHFRRTSNLVIKVSLWIIFVSIIRSWILKS